MAANNTPNQGRAVPAGYVAIPISTGQKAAPVRVSVVVRSKPDPVGGHLVVVRQAVDAKVYLGALVDAGGRVHSWLELWVQDLETVSQSLAGWREALTNALLDQRWLRNAELLSAVDASQVVRTGWETHHPVPVWLDVPKADPVTLADAGGETWRLCKDDAVLTAAGLPPYGASLHRYLFLPSKGPAAGFVPVTPEAPVNQNTRAADHLLGGRTDLVPFNPGGGLLLVREMAGVALEAYIDLLAGAPVQPVLHGRTPLHLFGGADGQAGADSIESASLPDGWLFLGQHGRWGRLLEAFYLRLRVVADVAAAARAFAERTQTPLLSLEPGRFQVRVGEAGAGLPTLWTAKAVLVDPGDTVEVPVEFTDTKFYLPGRPLAASVYRPAPVGQGADAEASVRIRRFITEPTGATVVEGTLATQDRTDALPQDLVRIWLPIGGGRVRLHANFDAQSGMAVGERRFRTLGHRFSADTLAALRAAEGIPIPKVRFEVLPLLSAPWDLYSVAVIGVRALMVNKSNSLALALDELMSLARRVADDHDQSVALRVRVRDVFESDRRYMESLGPHRLAWDGVTAKQVMDVIPSELWWDVLAMLVRALVGVGPDSTCRTFGDARPGALHQVFDVVTADLDRLLGRARSLIVIDWRYNREVSGVIRQALLQAGGQVAAAPAPAPARPAPAPLPATMAVQQPPPSRSAPAFAPPPSAPRRPPAASESPFR